MFGVEKPHERDGDCVTRTLDTMDRGIESDRQTHRERERGHWTERETGHNREEKSLGRSTGRDRTDQESRGWGQEIERGNDRSRGPGRDSGQEKAAEPKQKSVDLDMGL